LVLVINALVFVDDKFLNIYRNISIFNCIILVLVLYFNKRILKELINETIYLIFFFSMMLFTLLITGGGVGSVINLIYFIITFLALKYITLSTRQWIILISIYSLITIRYLLISDVYAINSYNTEFTQINNNIIAFFITLISITTVIVLNYLTELNNTSSQKIFKIYLPFITLIIGFITVTNLGSRGSLITLLFFTFFYFFFPKGLFKYKNVAIIFYLFFVIIGFLIPLFYIYMYRNGIEITEVGSIEKETFTGREIIWSALLNELHGFKNLLFGLGSEVPISGFHDMHNSQLSIIKNFGLTGIVLFYGFFFLEIKSMFHKSEYITKTKILSIFSFSSFILLGSFEALSSFSPIYFLSVMSLSVGFNDRDIGRYSQKKGEVNNERNKAIGSI
jgi:hypothetical protein